MKMDIKGKVVTKIFL